MRLLERSISQLANEHSKTKKEYMSLIVDETPIHTDSNLDNMTVNGYYISLYKQLIY